MYESKYGTNKPRPSWVSVSQVYVLYPCNYDNKMIFDFDFDFSLSRAIGMSWIHWALAWIIIARITACHGPVTVSIASLYPNQLWHYVNWTPKNIFLWTFNQNSIIFIQENVFGNVVWKMTSILSRLKCIYMIIYRAIYQSRWFPWYRIALFASLIEIMVVITSLDCNKGLELEQQSFLPYYDIDLDMMHASGQIYFISHGIARGRTWCNRDLSNIICSLPFVYCLSCAVT